VCMVTSFGDLKSLQAIDAREGPGEKRRLVGVKEGSQPNVAVLRTIPSWFRPNRVYRCRGLRGLCFAEIDLMISRR